MVAQTHLLVVFIYKHQLRFMASHLVFMHLRERSNDQQVAHAGTTCSRAVDRNHARTTLAFDGVGDEAFAVVDVPDVDLFVLTDVGGVQQVFVDGAGAFVMELAMMSASLTSTVAQSLFHSNGTLMTIL
jgi:hypothetical protein